MNLRIVVADERQANFFDVLNPNGPLTPRGSVQNSKAGMRDTDLETDRAGRRFGGASGVSHGSGPAQGHHHGVDGERSTERHDVELFAKEIAHRIDHARAQNEFDKLMLVAPPKMLGLLRQSLPATAQSFLAGEISKDLVQHGPEAILRLIPPDAFFQ
jgi:protein required for attachment to host cells